MRIRIRNKRRFFISISILILLIIIAINGKQSLNKSAASDVIDSKNTNSNKSDNKSGSSVSFSKDGSIFFEESNYFKKYIIILVDKEHYKGYKEDNKNIYVDIKNIDKHKLNSNSFKEQDQNIFLSKVDGNNKLTIKKDFNNNNFVYLNQLTNELLVLISKKKNPFAHTVIVDPGMGEEILVQRL